MANRDPVADFEKIRGRVNSLLVQLGDEAPKAMLKVMQTILDRALPITPMQTGRLRKSGYAEVNKEGTKYTAAVGFAKNDEPPYAIYVHENMEAKHEPPTQAKFLQTATEQSISDIPVILYDELKKNTDLKGG